MEHFRLSSGTQITRAGGDSLQVWLDPVRRAQIADNSATRELLRRLTSVDQDVVDPDDPTLKRLVNQQLAISVSELSAREERRTRTRLFVSGMELPACQLFELGLQVTTDLDQASVAILSGTQIHLATTLTDSGVPHLLADFPGDTPRLGPFVVPGRTPCLSCISLQGYDAVPHPDLGDLAKPSRDPLAAALASSFLIRELTTWLDGGTPWTWARTILLGTNPELSQIRTWLRHPECACTWI
jgi:hypothetical protein